MKKFIIDRFEGELAVCETETKEKIYILISNLPVHAKEGDCLFEDEDGIIRIDMMETKKRRDKIRSKMDGLWE